MRNILSKVLSLSKVLIDDLKGPPIYNLTPHTSVDKKCCGSGQEKEALGSQDQVNLHLSKKCWESNRDS